MKKLLFACLLAATAVAQPRWTPTPFMATWPGKATAGEAADKLSVTFHTTLAGLASLNFNAAPNVVFITDSGQEGVFIKTATASLPTWAASDVTGMAVSEPGATGKRVRQWDGSVNVKWFGAVADGVTDDKAAWEAALLTGFPIYMPSGTSIIGSQLTTEYSKFVIHGDKDGGSEIQFGITNVTSKLGESLFIPDSATLIDIEDVTFRYGMAVFSVNDVWEGITENIELLSIKRCGFESLYYGLWYNPANTIPARTNEIKRMELDGLKFSADTSAFTNAGFFGAYFREIAIRDVTIKNCDFDNVSRAIHITHQPTNGIPAAVIIENCTIRNVNHDQVRGNVWGFDIRRPVIYRNCQFLDSVDVSGTWNPSTVDYYHVAIYGSEGPVTIDNCLFKDWACNTNTTASRTYETIDVKRGANLRSSVVIKNSLFKDTRGYATGRIGSQSQSLSIEGCTWDGVSLLLEPNYNLVATQGDATTPHDYINFSGNVLTNCVLTGKAVFDVRYTTANAVINFERNSVIQTPFKYLALVQTSEPAMFRGVGNYTDYSTAAANTEWMFNFATGPAKVIFRDNTTGTLGLLRKYGGTDHGDYWIDGNTVGARSYAIQFSDPIGSVYLGHNKFGSTSQAINGAHTYASGESLTFLEDFATIGTPNAALYFGTHASADSDGLVPGGTYFDSTKGAVGMWANGEYRYFQPLPSVSVGTPAAGVYAPDLLSTGLFTINMGGDLILTNAVNVAVGRSVQLRILNDQATNCVLTLDTDWHSGGEASPVTVGTNAVVWAAIQAVAGAADTDVDCALALEN